MRVAVTGSAGCLARALLPRLLAEPRVTAVLGLDLRPARLRHARYAEHRVDLRRPGLETLLAGCDAVVHLAALVLPRPGRRPSRAERREHTLALGLNVYEAARRAGVARFVHASSAAVYGAWPDNPARLTEDAPLRPNPGFAYAEDKAALDIALREAAARGGPALVNLRLHAIVGPRAQPLLRALLRQPFHPRLPDPQPLLQCLWEDDAAGAVVRALFHGPPGTYNISAQPPLAFRDLHRRLHRRSRAVPARAWFGVHRAVARLWPAAGEPAALAALAAPLVLDTTRAESLLGWRPVYDTAGCVEALGRALHHDRRKHG